MANRYYNNTRFDGERLSASDLESIEAGFTFLEEDSLLIANNLSDLTNAAVARENLGLGTVAAADVGIGHFDAAAGIHDHTLTGGPYLYGVNNFTDVLDPDQALKNLGAGSAIYYKADHCVSGPNTTVPNDVASNLHVHNAIDMYHDPTVTGHNNAQDAIAACMDLLILLVPPAYL